MTVFFQDTPAPEEQKRAYQLAKKRYFDALGRYWRSHGEDDLDQVRELRARWREARARLAEFGVIAF